MIRKILNRIRQFVVGIRQAIKKNLRRRVKGQHQLTSTTAHDRYPEIFGALQELIIDDESVRILSFGCSTGEECQTLRSYFPQATIVGIDINRGNLRQARRQNKDPRIKFYHSADPEVERLPPFTIILAMSVLCRWEDTRDLESCAQVYRFEDFDRQIGELIDQLADKGLLVVYNANFRVSDGASSARLDPVVCDTITESGFVHQFGADHRRLYETHNQVIFRRLGTIG